MYTRVDMKLWWSGSWLCMDLLLRHELVLGVDLFS